MRAAAALAFAVALRMRAAGRGGSEDEVEEVDEAEDDKEVVNAGWAVMWAGLWAVASAAARAGRMEGMSSGCRFRAGGWGGPVVTWRPGGPIWSAASGEGGAGLWPSLSGLGWAGVLQCLRLCGLASAGGNSSRGLHSGAGGGCPMPMVSSVDQAAAYQVCSHPASVCLVDHVLHGDRPDVMTLGSQRRTVAYYTRGE